VHVIVSCAMSVDGYLDDASDTRLVLSNEEDLAGVHDLRASVDAIMVGANTIRRDNPRLLVRDSMSGPTKVTVTASGDLDPASRFFTTGNVTKLVYAPTPAAGPLRDRLRDLATVIDCGAGVELPWILDDLAARGVSRLMVEGGGTLLTQLFTAGLADELRLAIAPLFVGDPRAPRFVHDGHFAAPMTLAEVDRLGEIVVLRYLFGQLAEDWRWLNLAFELSHLCPPSTTALSVGAVIVDADGREISRGYSRDTDDKVHAEESALSKVDPLDPRLKTATIYSSIEPCSKRASRPRTCSQLIVESGIRRVVFGLREPPTFVDGEGAEVLADAGIEVVELGPVPG
jgi:riboflavin-specific deaminase-like protein